MQKCLRRNHRACHVLSTKTPFLWTTAIAKSNSEDNPVQRIMAIDAIIDIQEVSK
jgi:hypothetical protein